MISELLRPRRVQDAVKPVRTNVAVMVGEALESRQLMSAVISQTVIEKHSDLFARSAQSFTVNQDFNLASLGLNARTRKGGSDVTIRFYEFDRSSLALSTEVLGTAFAAEGRFSPEARWEQFSLNAAISLKAGKSYIFTFEEKDGGEAGWNDFGMTATDTYSGGEYFLNVDWSPPEFAIRGDLAFVLYDSAPVVSPPVVPPVVPPIVSPPGVPPVVSPPVVPPTVPPPPIVSPPVVPPVISPPAVPPTVPPPVVVPPTVPVSPPVSPPTVPPVVTAPSVPDANNLDVAVVWNGNASATAGQIARGSVGLTMKNVSATDTLKGKLNFGFYLSTDDQFDAQDRPVLAWSGRANIAAGSEKSLSRAIRRLPLIDAGDYHLVARVITPGGGISTGSTAERIRLEEPNVKLQPTAASFESSTLVVGKAAFVRVAVQNSGNVTAIGKIGLDLSLEPAEGTMGLASAVIKGFKPIKVKLAPSQSRTYLVRFDLPDNLLTGARHITFSATPVSVNASVLEATVLAVDGVFEVSAQVTPSR